MLFDKRFVLSIAGLLAQFAQAQDATAPEDSAVVKLTGETFGKFLEENPLVMAEFYAPWCGHCKHLAPEYVKAAGELAEKGIKLAQVDCEQELDLCAGQNVRGYPTLKVFHSGASEEGMPYTGARKAEEIVAYMLRQAEPAVTVLEGKEAAQDLEDLLAESKTAVVVDGGVKGLNESFYELANLLRNDFVFVQYPTKKPTLAVHLPGEKEPIVFEGKNTTLPHLVDWISVESLPYFGEVDAITYQKYMTSDLPLAYFFYSSEEEREQYAGLFRKLGKAHRGSLNFAGLDAVKYGQHAENLNMKQQFPLFVIHNATSDLKYGLPQLSDEEVSAGTAVTIKEADIEKFVVDFLDSKIEPIIKSEDVPEVQESSVYKLVATTHDQIVKDEDKDVLVKYYAPWCGHCKKMAPTFEELADVYANDEDAKNKVLIADIDATLNDVHGVVIEGFPTIVLYPAGKDSTPVVYQRSRSLEEFLDFIKEEGTHKVDGQAIHARNAETAADKPAEKAEAEAEDADLERDEL
ncbi:AFR718Wp [Eremothecium gossypii ATCC 10895]|uniref:Protein disulfide-isomerase n=1 Tax=Eremothecium gossypii (strain ATCC 10895 / CBS 109.51 / FGSC 9923 / NRRL Y-1056) TaxID=284811 RepID=Q751V7_EREGS|nr:AFR718Wp [Eremothecium gossypii ATCC 10895]AAS54090.2 AFR718Wp [Eremothecium gossypii ATCC 10895]AEY98405.1 FAFR718Wp [Eremothecium gossypii FDAG1]